jgi:FkbM family methyltransferase
MITEVFCFEAYEIKLKIKPKLIVDAGANKGSSAVYFSAIYPEATIHCLEPNSDLFDVLKFNLESNHVHAEIIQKALSNRDGEMSFVKDANHQYSMLSEAETNVKVQTTTLRSLYADQQIDILKLDIEGAEAVVIPEVAKATNIGLVIQEIHYDRVNFDEILSTLKKADFTIASPYSQYKWLNSKVTYPILLAYKNL